MTLPAGTKLRCKDTSDILSAQITLGKVYTLAKDNNGGNFIIWDDHGLEHGYFQWRFDVVEEIKSPIRTVTKKELVLGTYGRVSISSEGLEGTDTIGLDFIPEGLHPVHWMNHQLNNKELREAAKLFIELAEYLEGKS